jgi:tetratricopeptide (TPR) repeat protein
VFVVHNDAEVVHNDAESQETLDVHKLDFRSVGIASWKVKVAIGLVYDFSDFRTLQKYIKEGRVTTADKLSHDAEIWAEIGSLGDLEAHFIQVYRDAREATKAESPAADVDEKAAEVAAALAAAEEPAEEPAIEIEADEDEDSDEAPVPDANAGQLADDLLAAVEAAAEAEDGAIDVDLDTLLEEATSDAVPPRRVNEQKAISKVQATGNQNATDHQFVDPFEALKQQRSVRTRGRPSGTSKVGKKKKEAVAVALKKRKSKTLFLGALVVGLGLVFMYQMPSADVETVAAQSAADLATAAAKDAAKARAESVRKQMKDELNAALESVNKDDVDAFQVKEAQLIAVKPSGLGGGPPGMGMPSGARSGGVPGAGLPGGVDQRASSPRDLIALGSAAARGGRWSDAASAFRQAANIEPNNADAHARLGQALYKLGDQGGAESELRRAASGGSTMAHKVLGHMAREQGDDSGAIAHYQTYLNSGPSDRASIEALIRRITN